MAGYNENNPPNLFPDGVIPEQFGRRDYLALAALFCLALALRLIRLFDLDLIFDEAVLLIQARESFAGIWNLCKTDNFPPLYSWLVKIWMSLGSGADWFRLFGVLMASLTPPAAYLLGREISRRRFGWALGVLCAVSATFMYYSQFVRMYNVQPLLACLSLYWFFKALKTGHWRHWMLTCLANLLGFYVYVFMTFIVIAQGLILGFYFRLNLRRYWKPLVSQAPFFLGALVWMIPTLQRYTHVQQAFWTPPLTWQIVALSLLNLGAGGDFRSTYWLTAILLLPLIVGFILGLTLKPRHPQIVILGLITVFVIVSILVISLGSRSFFHDRYLVYVLPFALAVSLAGWMCVRRVALRRAGLVLLFLTSAIFLIHYYVEFNYIHRFVGLLPENPTGAKGEGHGLSMTAVEVSQRLQSGEVIVHYSEPYLRICSYLSSRVYRQRELPEYVFSSHEIEEHNGRQYLKPGDWIRSLSDWKTAPVGIWLITLNDPEDLQAMKPPIWILEENFPLELSDAGYHIVEIIMHFRVSAIHYKRDVGATTP